jgi:hypothetical protein
MDPFVKITVVCHSHAAAGSADDRRAHLGADKKMPTATCEDVAVGQSLPVFPADGTAKGFRQAKGELLH